MRQRGRKIRLLCGLCCVTGFLAFGLADAGARKSKKFKLSALGPVPIPADNPMTPEKVELGTFLNDVNVEQLADMEKVLEKMERCGMSDYVVKSMAKHEKHIRDIEVACQNKLEIVIVGTIKVPLKMPL